MQFTRLSSELDHTTHQTSHPHESLYDQCGHPIGQNEHQLDNVVNQ